MPRTGRFSVFLSRLERELNDFVNRALADLGVRKAMESALAAGNSPESVKVPRHHVVLPSPEGSFC